MKEIIINVDNYNENSIKTIEGDNLSEVYKIYICKNKRRIDLTNKIAIMAYVNEYGNKKSNILALNITNASQGEIELPITNVISSENGVYACQIAIYGENNSLEQTAPFSLIVENNIFSKISNAAINSSDFHILSEAIKTTNTYGEKLKEGTENIELQYAKKLNEKLDKDGIVTMANMGQDVKEKFTGGAVAVVGENAVNTINLRDKSISFNKMDKELQDLYDVRYRNLAIKWIEGSYISSAGNIVAEGSYSYSRINVLPGEQYRISGKHNWQAICYLVKDSNGNVLLTDGASDSEATVIKKEFTIPERGTELYINNRGTEFEFLQIKNKVKLDIKDESINLNNLELKLQKFFNLSFRPITDINWIENSYINSNGVTVTMDDPSYGYYKLNVKEGDVFRINGMKAWQSVCYLVKDSNGNVALHDGRPNSEKTVINENIIIPKDGIELYIGKYGFVSLYAKDSVYLNFKDNSVPFKALENNLRDNFKLCFRDVDKIEWIQKHYVTQEGVITPIEDSSYSYAKISVLPGEEYRITGQKVWSSSCYVVKDARGNVVLHDNKPSGAKTDVVNEIFTIPSDGVELYVGGRGFKYLEKKSELINSRITSNLRDKLIVFNGDSICQGIVNGGGYAEILRKTTGCLIENRAVGGGTLAINKRNGHMICNDIVNMSENADLICLEGGINDYWQNIPLGEMKPLTDFESEVDKETVLGALESIFRTCMEKWLGVPIMFVIVHPVQKTRYMPNSVGYTFEQLAEGIRKMCKKYSIVVVDLLNESGGFNGNIERIAKKYTINGGDGCHPNEEGYKKYYVPQIKAKLETLISE
ncbi:SGNH/GDSL hydrolase family protein [Clostridium perfringens]|uniref:SGNH/GDSL hydrolase family protein n=1 Tax=Clostridium perfringens TaxID=1502 RepID=UPI002246BC00|nr:SGNH/GDSL hydrolase family protein [Clostridium perfringens]MCX0390658.1 SGNH/GDSL hydrolase family protein [Clostridium perfringens]